MASFGSSPLEFETFNTQSVELFGAEFATFTYQGNDLAAGSGGQQDLTDQKGMLLMRDTVASGAVNLIPWTPLKASQPIAVLGSDVIHGSTVTEVEIRAIRKGDIALNLLNYFDDTGTDQDDSYPLLSTLVGSATIPTTEEATDLLAQSLLFARFIQDELTKFDNIT